MTPGDALLARTIDSMDLPPIDVCKMDIEGSEESALRGMAATLARSPNLRLLIECNGLSDQASLTALLRTHFAHISKAGRHNLWCY